MQQSQKYRNERIITGQYRQLLRRRHEILDFQDGAIIYIHRIPLRNDDGKCIGMPHHRFLSGLNWNGGGLLSPSVKMLLTTGFCGGFTTFSTFMNEGYGLMKDGSYTYMMLYLFGSLALGLLAVLAGHYWLNASHEKREIHT